MSHSEAVSGSQRALLNLTCILQGDARLKSGSKTDQLSNELLFLTYVLAALRNKIDRTKPNIKSLKSSYRKNVPSQPNHRDVGETLRLIEAPTSRRHRRKTPKIGRAVTERSPPFPGLTGNGW